MRHAPTRGARVLRSGDSGRTARRGRVDRNARRRARPERLTRARHGSDMQWHRSISARGGAANLRRAATAIALAAVALAGCKGGPSGCGDPALSDAYLSGCSERTWVVTRSTASCFVGSTFLFGADGRAVHVDHCTGDERDAPFRVDGSAVSLHGHSHAASMRGSDVELALDGHVFTISHVGGCDTPSLSPQYLSGCGARDWVVTESTSECFVGSTFTFADDGAEEHFDACLGSTRLESFEVRGLNVLAPRLRSPRQRSRRRRDRAHRGRSSVRDRAVRGASEAAEARPSVRASP